VKEEGETMKEEEEEEEEQEQEEEEQEEEGDDEEKQGEVHWLPYENEDDHSTGARRDDVAAANSVVSNSARKLCDLRTPMALFFCREPEGTAAASVATANTARVIGRFRVCALKREGV
jgi:hypothetical protein